MLTTKFEETKIDDESSDENESGQISVVKSDSKPGSHIRLMNQVDLEEELSRMMNVKVLEQELLEYIPSHQSEASNPIFSRLDFFINVLL